MTFVQLPTITDVFSNTTGASAWGAPAFAEFMPAMWWAIGSMAVAIILLWVFQHLQNIRDFMVSHFINQSIQQKSNLSWKEKRAIFGDMQEIIDENNLKRKINRLGYLFGEFKNYNHPRGYSS